MNKKIIFLLASTLSVNAMALDLSNPLVVKIRGHMLSTSASQKGLSGMHPRGGADQKSVGKLFEMGVGAELSASMFFTDNFATEIGSGLTIVRAKKSSINDVAYNYNATDIAKKKDIYAIPSYATVQYHIAPYGAIRPYVGGGLHYTYLKARGDQYKVKSGAGLVAQAGVDFVFTDDTYLNLDIKYMTLKSKVNYNKGFVKTDTEGPVSSNLKINPMYFGLGFGIKL
jgi:outer membrane protein